MHAYDCMTEWLNRRQQYRHAPDPGTEGPPAFGVFYDVGGESIAALVHAVLGALVAGVLGTSGQVSGGFAVFAAGASAPLILVQLKNSRLAEAILGEGAVTAGATQPAAAAGNGPERVLDNAQESLPAQRPGTGAPEPPQVRQPPSSDSSSQQDRPRRPAADQDGAG
ncbi:hypothetical protein OG806_49730 [Streptomyces sp. NBC_00882]|uniref:hypothetical protein n=1 Tax=Streptomyces sp. NBC_00882 TaxID=2975856 RepID=UPI003865858F|nr:hypothetical protein OG806_00215 [Streptomyces sp. NBC_00882]WSZ36898.1 hypothetical protein OG806_49730 [Streptomyces sp. NBC_00882]